MAKQKELDDETQLVRYYERWEYLREHGGSDPYHDDSEGLNLERNHIISAKVQLEKKYGNDLGKYPECYFRELPPEVDKGFMVRAAEIRDKAAESLDCYLADKNFGYLLCNKELLTKKEVKDISIENVLGYAAGLADALRKDDLITMRRHAFYSDSYLESFAQCAEKVKKILEQKKNMPVETNDQMTLFQMGLGQSR